MPVQVSLCECTGCSGAFGFVHNRRWMSQKMACTVCLKVNNHVMLIREVLLLTWFLHTVNKYLENVLVWLFHFLHLIPFKQKAYWSRTMCRFLELTLVSAICALFDVWFFFWTSLYQCFPYFTYVLKSTQSSAVHWCSKYRTVLPAVQEQSFDKQQWSDFSKHIVAHLQTCRFQVILTH